MSKKINISIIGATGYTALELIRILQNHPYAEIRYLISANHAGQKISDIYPHLLNVCDLQISNTDLDELAEKSDVIFLALPNFESQKIIPEIIGKTKIIDLSGDFRVKNLGNYEKYYGQKHSSQEHLEKFTYGLVEINKEVIKNSNNIANPGCFATAIGLALLPIKDLISSVDVFAMTGSSGSGKNPKIETHHPIRSHNISSYKISSHQHNAELFETLNLKGNQITFVPSRGPFVRGIFANCFVDLNCKIDGTEIIERFNNFYKKSFFVRIKEKVQLVDVVGSNFCDISFKFTNNKLIVQSVIDNLVKGAAGSAIQNMNLMFGFDETIGLKNLTPNYL